MSNENENEILVCIYSDIFSNIEQIKTSRLRIQKIKNSIKNLNNNYFDVKCNDPFLVEYLNMFDDTNINNDISRNLDILKTYIQYKLDNKCTHEWVNDTIDIDPDRSQDICYCIKCEVTKK